MNQDGKPRELPRYVFNALCSPRYLFDDVSDPGTDFCQSSRYDKQINVIIIIKHESGTMLLQLIVLLGNVY